MKYIVSVSGHRFEIEVEHDRLVRIDGRPCYVDFEQVGGLSLYSLGMEERGHVVFVQKGSESYQVEVQGRRYPVQVRSETARLGTRPSRCRDDAECQVVCAPLAGRIVALPVQVGDRVEARQVLAVIESMKMQMEIKATQAGVVESIHGSPGRDVGQGEELLSIRAC